MRDDRHLWTDYHQARDSGDVEKARRLASAIVEHHLGFAIDYARRTAFGSWDEDTIQEYVAELVLIMLARVPFYDTSSRARFVTYCKPFFQPVRWKIGGNTRPIRQGYETERLSALIRRLQTEAMGEGQALSVEELASILSERHGKSIGVERVRRIVESPQVTSGDSSLRHNGHEMPVSVWDLLSADDDPADQVAEDAESDDRASMVWEALTELDLNELEMTIVTDVFMAPPRKVVGSEVVDPGPASDRDLSARLGVPEQHIGQLREHLAGRLRDLLG